MATPKGHFAPPPPQSGPDYALDVELARASPAMADSPAAWVARGRRHDQGAKAPRATFYIHPTTYLERDHWNAALDRGRRRRLSRAAVRPEPGERLQRRRPTSGRRAIARRRSAPSCSRARMRPRRSTSPIATCSRRSTSSSPRSPSGTPDHPRRAQPGRAPPSRLLVDRRGRAQGPARRGLCRRLAAVGHRRPARDGPRAVQRARPGGLHAVVAELRRARQRLAGARQLGRTEGRQRGRAQARRHAVRQSAERDARRRGRAGRQPRHARPHRRPRQRHACARPGRGALRQGLPADRRRDPAARPLRPAGQ